MTLKAQVWIILTLFVILGIIINMLRKRELELKYVLTWLGCDLVLIMLTCFPTLLNKLAVLLGIKSPMNMVFFLGFLFSLIIIFSLTVALSRVTAKVRKITQALAILTEAQKKEILEDKK